MYGGSGVRPISSTRSFRGFSDSNLNNRTPSASDSITSARSFPSEKVMRVPVRRRRAGRAKADHTFGPISRSNNSSTAPPDGARSPGNLAGNTRVLFKTRTSLARRKSGRETKVESHHVPVVRSTISILDASRSLSGCCAISSAGRS